MDLSRKLKRKAIVKYDQETETENYEETDGKARQYK